MNLVKVLNKVDQEYYQSERAAILSAIDRRAWGELQLLMNPELSEICNSSTYAAIDVTRDVFMLPYYWWCWPQLSKALGELGAFLEWEDEKEQSWLNISDYLLPVPWSLRFESELPYIPTP